MMNVACVTAVFLALTAPYLAASDFATQVAEATFKLGKGAFGTCFLVRREAPDTAVYLVTAGHAFNENNDPSIVLVLREPKPNGSYERREHTLTLRLDGKPQWVRHEEHDVAVLRIAQPLPVLVPSLPASVLADSARLKTSGVHVCSPLFVFGYPMGLEADTAGLPVARQGIFASSPMLPLLTHPTFLADYNAFKGDSGGPVFIAGPDNRPLVVGIVTDQHYYDDDLKGSYQQYQIRNPLGVVKILHAQYFLDTLEAAAKLGGPEAD